MILLCWNWDKSNFTGTGLIYLNVRRNNDGKIFLKKFVSNYNLITNCLIHTQYDFVLPPIAILSVY